jgi:hypothetical protein
MREKRNAYWILVGEPEEKKDIDIDGKTILRQIIEK